MRLHHFGYAGQDARALRAWLEAHDALLVDVRMKPIARHPSWRGPALQRALGDRYRHVAALGNVNFRGGPVELVNAEAGVREVGELLAAGRPVVVMCVCRDYQVCHRRQVVELLAAAGWGLAEALELGGRP